MVVIRIEVKKRQECDSLAARKCDVKAFMLYIRTISEQILIEWPGELESRTSGEGQSDTQEIMWTLDTKQNPNHHLENSQGERKNFPTISVCIPHEGHSRDASSEVCVNQWVYMHRVLLILVCSSAEVMLIILCISTYCPESNFIYLWNHSYPGQNCWYKEL